MGYPASLALLNLLISKFDRTRRSSSISFDNFIECCLTIKGLSDKRQRRIPTAAVTEDGGITILAKLAKSMNELVVEEAAGGLWNLSVGEEHKERATGALANLAADDKYSMV